MEFIKATGLQIWQDANCNIMGTQKKKKKNIQTFKHFLMLLIIVVNFIIVVATITNNLTHNSNSLDTRTGPDKNEEETGSG